MACGLKECAGADLRMGDKSGREDEWTDPESGRGLGGGHMGGHVQ